MGRSQRLGGQAVAGAHWRRGLAGYSASVLGLCRAHHSPPTRVSSKTSAGRCGSCARGHYHRPCCCGYVVLVTTMNLQNGCRVSSSHSGGATERERENKAPPQVDCRVLRKCPLSGKPGGMAHVSQIGLGWPTGCRAYAPPAACISPVWSSFRWACRRAIRSGAIRRRRQRGRKSGRAKMFADHALESPKCRACCFSFAFDATQPYRSASRPRLD
jgi:hypothetical protein